MRIICKQSISLKLYHQLINYYIPVLVDSISYYNNIFLEANIAESKLLCKGAVGTGVSGGVDSSYTIAKYLNHNISAFRLSHCVYYEMGLYGNFDSGLEKQLRKRTRKIAEECGLSYLNIKSNICLALYKAAHAPLYHQYFRCCFGCAKVVLYLLLFFGYKGISIQYERSRCSLL